MIKGRCEVLRIIQAIAFFLISGFSVNAQWLQVGSKLVGTGSIGNPGQGIVSISADGKTAIVGGQIDNSNVGAAWIYTFDGSGFIQYGNKLNAADHIGASSQGHTVSISADGKTAAVGGQNDNTIESYSQGAAWIYTFNGSDFVQAVKLTGPDGWTEFGNEICVSADGKIVIVGRASWNYMFAIDVYSFNGTNFILLNEMSDPASAGGSFNGMSIAISANNNTILVATSYPANATWAYTFNGNDFVLAGNKIGSGGGYTGSAVDISADGKIAIIGDRSDNSASVYTFNGSNYVQLGNKLVGTGNIGISAQGYAVSISADGKTALVGGPLDNSSRGAVWIYTFNGSNYIQAGDKLIPSDYINRPNVGNSVDLSADGKIAIIGGPNDNFGGGASWVFINTSLPCAIVSISGISSNVNACEGANVKLSVEASGGFLTYSWYQNNSFLGEYFASEYKLPALDLSSTGNYFCVISNTCRSIATSPGINVTVNPLPTITGVVYPGSICPGGLVTINGLGAASYTLTGNNLIGTGFIPTVSGSYTISGTGANQCKNSAVVNVTVNSLPVLTIAGTSSICPGSSANLTASGANTYNWNNGLMTTPGISFSPTTNTIYSVTGTDINGCKDTVQFTVMINSLFLTSPGSNVGACACYSAILSVHAVGPVPIQYQWYENEILINGATGPDYETPAVDASGKIYKCVVSSLCETVTTPGTTVNIDCVIPTESEWIQAGCKFTGTGNIGGGQQGISTSVSADGQTVIVGGYSDDANHGAAWIFTFNGSTFKQSGNKLVGNGGIGASRQGSSVSISADGKTAIVGGSDDDDGHGAVWIYTFNGTSFVQLGNKLVGTGAIGAAQQGKSVSISSDGNTALVGGHADNNYVGAIWIYTFNGSSFVQLGSKIVGTNGKGALNYQGYAVDISSDGKTIVVGGLLDDSGTGAVWVHTFNGHSFEQAGPKLKGKDATGNPQQGASVGISGDGKTIISGGYIDNNEEGAAWVFTFNGTNYTQMGSKLVGTNNTGKTQQGVGVDISKDGKIAVVGGLKDGYLINQIRTGATWIYTFNGISFVQTGEKLVGTGHIAHSMQGISVSASEDAKFILIGGYGDNEGIGAIWAFVNPNINCTLPVVKSDTSEIRICQGSQVTLSVDVSGSGLLKYDWYKDGRFLERKYANDKDPARHITDGEGNYICVASNTCGTVTSSTIIVNSKPLQEISLDLSSINGLCDTLSPIKLTGGLPLYGSYWYNNMSVTSLNTSQPGDYLITYRFKDQINCIYTISGILTSIHCSVPGICERPIVPCYCTNTCPPRFRIYTGITPNGDGYNETWIIDSLYTPNKVIILDRWNNDVYHTDDYQQDWDGTDQNGKPLPTGVYYYIIKIGPDKRRIPGTVSIIR